ncbi:hypothetical protein TWF506_008457 [Arthrobotrys conoides]|uniref:Uncharacterized protein n=1 Tax=Arthrobotrys conoides TaxID=74498 RepID=A0AAN8NMA5_9PEZI
MPPRNQNIDPHRFDIVLYGVKEPSICSRYTRPQLTKIPNIESFLVRNKDIRYFEVKLSRHLGGNPAALYNIRTRRLVTVSYEYCYYDLQHDAGFRRVEVKDIEWDGFLEDTFEALRDEVDDIWQVVYFRPKASFFHFLKAPCRLLETGFCALVGWNPVVYLEDLTEGYYLTTWRSRLKYAWIRGAKEGKNFIRWVEGKEKLVKRRTLRPCPELPKWHFMGPEQQGWLKPSFPQKPEPVEEPLPAPQPGFTVIPTSPEVPSWLMKSSSRLSPIQEEPEPPSPVWRGVGLWVH